MALTHLIYYIAIIISSIFLLHLIIAVAKSVLYYSGSDFPIDLYTNWIHQAINQYITLLLALFIFCWSMVYLNFCVHCIYNKVKPISSRELLKDQAPTSSTYSYEPSLTITSPNNKSVVLLVHGAWDNPAFLKPIINHIKINHQDYDIATSLLHKHGGTLQDLLDFSYTQACANVKDDINYLLGKYDKVLCIGHSLGGSILSDLGSSVDQNLKLNDKTSIILYNPALYPRDLTFIDQLGRYTLGGLFGYLINGDVGGYDLKDSLAYAYCQVPPTTAVVDGIYNNSEVANRIKADKNALKNFAYIINTDDSSIKAADIKAVLDTQLGLKTSTYKQFLGAKDNHRLHAGTNQHSIDHFMSVLSDTINKIYNN